MPASFQVTSAEDPVSVVGAPSCPGDDVSGQRLTGAARVSKAVLTSVQRETTAVRHSQIYTQRVVRAQAYSEFE